MADLIFVALTLFCFGVARAYVAGCDKLKARPTNG